jgi:hypothetical protein
MLTEVGGFLVELAGVPAAERDRLYQFYDSFKMMEELLAKHRNLLEGIASLPFLAGFCYT